MRAPVSEYFEKLAPFLASDAVLEDRDGIPADPTIVWDETLQANAHYFGQHEWMQGWLQFVHRYPEFRERWLKVAGEWDGKVLVDVGCGPGNLLKSLQHTPAIAIGVDVGVGSLRLADENGYVPLLADAHRLPLRSEIADVVALNATLHHCVDMAKVLLESARLVKPGGLMVLDHDPQHSAWDFRGLGLAMWKLRKPLYRWMGRGGHRAEGGEQEWAERTEIHHRPGDGISEPMLREALESAGFEVTVYPHNHHVGAGVVEGNRGEAPLKLRMGQKLSGIDSKSAEGALSLMCVARRLN